jgi:hypothetical protein
LVSLAAVRPTARHSSANSPGSAPGRQAASAQALAPWVPATRLPAATGTLGALRGAAVQVRKPSR